MNKLYIGIDGNQRANLFLECPRWQAESKFWSGLFVVNDLANFLLKGIKYSKGDLFQLEIVSVKLNSNSD